MTSYLNEDEQVEALKKWWKENGKSIVIGITLGLAALFGWQGWQAYRVAEGEAASKIYSTMQGQAGSGDMEAAMVSGKRLLGEYTDSVYASFAALRLAQLAYARGDKAGAAENLQWVVSHAPDEAITDLARMRLAHVRIDQEQPDQAMSLLAEVSDDFMPAGVSELRGDIARAQGDLEAARRAYSAALATGADNLGTVRMKLREIGTAEQSS